MLKPRLLTLVQAHLARHRMVRQNARSLENALNRLIEAERMALDRIADDNSEANRSAYLEIHKTLETVRSDLQRHAGVVKKILKFLHLAP